MNAPFPWFGGKRQVADLIWQRFGAPHHYIEPFFGGGAVLLAAPQPASLEVVCDANGFLANFWRAAKHQPWAVAEAVDYPVSHIDLGARHAWLMEQRDRLGAELKDPDWVGDAKVAGWWLWGHCAWIGHGWCDWFGAPGRRVWDQIPHVIDGGRGVHSLGDVSRNTNVGIGVRLLTSQGRAAWVALHELAERLGRVRIIHGDWTRAMNIDYGVRTGSLAVFLDPPYANYESVYGSAPKVAHRAAEWARANETHRVAICGHAGDYDLPGWDVVAWKRIRKVMGSSKTRDAERIWFSPGCLKPDASSQLGLFGGAA